MFQQNYNLSSAIYHWALIDFWRMDSLTKTKLSTSYLNSYVHINIKPWNNKKRSGSQMNLIENSKLCWEEDVIWGRNTRNNRFRCSAFCFLLIWKELFPYLHIEPIHFITDKENQISSAVMKSKNCIGTCN